MPSYYTKLSKDDFYICSSIVQKLQALTTESYKTSLVTERRINILSEVPYMTL